MTDTLSKYRSKRDFQKTAEPSGQAKIGTTIENRVASNPPSKECPNRFIYSNPLFRLRNDLQVEFFQLFGIHFAWCVDHQVSG